MREPLRSLLLGAVCVVFLAGCATQRYGRQTNLSKVEMQELGCREIRIEIAKSEEFLGSVRKQRADTNVAHVMGFLGDFGVGNALEGDAAEASGRMRLKELQDLSAQKGC